MMVRASCKDVSAEVEGGRERVLEAGSIWRGRWV